MIDGNDQYIQPKDISLVPLLMLTPTPPLVQDNRLLYESEELYEILEDGVKGGF